MVLYLYINNIDKKINKIYSFDESFGPLLNQINNFKFTFYLNVVKKENIHTHNYKLIDIDSEESTFVNAFRNVPGALQISQIREPYYFYIEITK